MKIRRSLESGGGAEDSRRPHLVLAQGNGA